MISIRKNSVPSIESLARENPLTIMVRESAQNQRIKKTSKKGFFHLASRCLEHMSKRNVPCIEWLARGNPLAPVKRSTRDYVKIVPMSLPNRLPLAPTQRSTRDYTNIMTMPSPNGLPFLEK